MNEVDEHGWAHIHHAAKKGYFKSVEKFIKAADDQLEFETQDSLRETPLLIAVRTGIENLDTIKVIVELNGNLEAINTLNHGIVEICCLQGHVALLDYLLKLNRKEINVWRQLLKFCSSDNDEEAESACKCLSQLVRPTDHGAVNPNWKQVFLENGVAILVNIIKSTIGDNAKAQALQCLINILKQQEVKESMHASNGLEILIRLLKSTSNQIIKFSSICLASMCTISKYAEQASQLGAVLALVTVIKASKANDVLIEVVKAVGTICEGSEVRQTLLNNTSGGIQSFCATLVDCTHAELLLALTQTISKICRRHQQNQNKFLDYGGASYIIGLCEMKNREIQLSAVDTVHMLVENNGYAQKIVAREGAITPLMNLLRRSKNTNVQEKTAGALWALAGDDGEEKRAMAIMMQVDLLIEFVGSLSESLHFIGSESLAVLAQGAHNKQDAIAEANGVHPLIRLLKCDKEYLVLSAVRCLRHLCVGVGYQTHRTNQNTIAQARGIKLLLALMTLSQSELIQVESALTLASASLGNTEVMNEITKTSEHLEFSYIRILKLLYSKDKAVRLLAGATLATFAYNSSPQQQTIALEGGVRFSCFEDFLHSEDEYYRCNAAFQVIVMARIIPDEEQATSSAAGIKLIVDILHESQSYIIQALAADCVARLAHTRAGISGAFIAVGSVHRLCDLMSSAHGQVRGCSAIALGYLSYHHAGERQLLNRCRKDPYLIKCLLYYTNKKSVSPQFIDEWRHYRKVGGLPPIQKGRPKLVSQDGFMRKFSKSLDDQPNESKSQLALSRNNSLSRSHESLIDEGRISSRKSQVFPQGEDQISEQSIEVS